MANKHKATIYWAERAMLPTLGFTQMEVKEGFGFVHGSIMCNGNFNEVEVKRLSDYVRQSQSATDKTPIWC